MNRKIVLGNPAPVSYKASQLGNEPERADAQPVFDTFTEIFISPDSSLLQAVAEIKKIWSIHSHDPSPAWVGFSEDMRLIATVVVAEFGGTAQLREGAAS